MMQNNELNDLYDYGFKIYQNNKYFKFSSDSVLLSELVNITKKDVKILDLCTGNAPIPMMLTSIHGNLDITGVELTKEIYDLGVKSLEYNNLTNIKLINDDIKNITNRFNNKFDIVTCNPPYFEVTENINKEEIKAIARHEIKLTLEDIISTTSKVIKNGGYFYMVHREERLADICVLLNKYNFGLKKVIPVFNESKSRCVFILIEAMYNGKNYVKIGNPIYLSHSDKSYKNIFKKR